MTDPAQAEAGAITALAQITGLSADAAGDLSAKARAFLAQLPEGNPVSIHTVTPRVAGDLPPALPVIISSPTAVRPGNMLIIDARELRSEERRVGKECRL